MVVFLLPAMIFLGWLSWPVFLKAFTIGEMSSNYGGLIQWPILLAPPVGFGLLALQGLSEIVKRIAALRGEITLDSHYSQPLQ
jgi:TRAP-type mannitol/chloroaromatic compound transport system permease small subunit